MKPSEVKFPFLGEKLDYLCAKLGINQYIIADLFSISPSAISKWRDTCSIPKPKVGILCKYLGIGIDELKTDSMEEFRKGVQKRLDNSVGTRWKILARQSLSGWLNFDVITPNIVKSFGLKGVYSAIQFIKIPSSIKKTTLNDGVRFRIGIVQAELLNNQLKTILLFIENPECIQLLTTDSQDPQQFMNDGYYFVPPYNSPPFYIGLPMGKHTAYFVTLAVSPPVELWQTFAEKPDGYAADMLAKWIIEEKIIHKINKIDFLVNA